MKQPTQQVSADLTETVTPIGRVRWRLSSVAETDASDLASAHCYRRSENVGIGAVIVAELKFSDVQRQIFAAYLVETAHDAALQERPKAVDCLRVDNAINILLFGVANEAVRKIVLQLPIAGMFVGRDQADFLRNRHANEGVHGFGIGIVGDTGHDVVLAAHCTDDDGLASNSGSGRFLIPMPIAVAAAHIGFVNLNDAPKLGFRLNESGADFMAHGMRGAVGAEAHHPLDLECADPLLAGQHQVDDLEPLAERLVRVLKDGARDMREAIGSQGSAIVALTGKLPPRPPEPLNSPTWAIF